MRRFADLFIAICIPVVALSSGAVAYFQFEAAPRMAFAFALAVGVGLVLIRLDGLRRRNQRDTEAKLLALARRLTEFGGDLEAIQRRLGAVEDGGSRRTRDDIEQLVAEVEVIGTLTRQVIETVADLEINVAESRSAALRATPPQRAGAAPQARADQLRPAGGA